MKAYKSILEIKGKLNRVSLYLPPTVGITVIEEMAEKEPEEVFLNPGSASEALVKKANTLGLNIIQACSILDIGESPVEY